MKVKIAVTRKVEYCSIVEMSQSMFERLNFQLEQSQRARVAAEKEINDLIDSKDWQDDEFLSLDDFEEIKDA